MRTLWIDIETTGLSIYQDKIVELAMILDTDGTTQERVFRFNPEKHIDEKATFVHGISFKDVKDSPIFSELAKDIFKVFKKVDYLAGYNCRKFDIPLLQIELLRVNSSYDISKIPVIDVFEHVEMFEPNKKLTSVYLRYFNQRLEKAHSALEDVKGAKRVYEYLQSKLS